MDEYESQSQDPTTIAINEEMRKFEPIGDMYNGFFPPPVSSVEVDGEKWGLSVFPEEPDGPHYDEVVLISSGAEQPAAFRVRWENNNSAVFQSGDVQRVEGGIRIPKESWQELVDSTDKEKVLPLLRAVNEQAAQPPAQERAA